MSVQLPASWTNVVAARAEPGSAEETAAAIRDATARDLAVYPVGGGVGLGCGAPPVDPGIAIETSRLDAIVDYPARDMTITLGAGVRMGRLAATLAAEGQHLPIDAPRATDATIGGVVAASASGPRRFGCGTIRDFVIGIEAVDGTGRIFHGGGAVVKNVAGYDFCKLLVGSLGMLGVVTRITLKTAPAPPLRRWIIRACDDLGQVDRLTEALLTSEVRPVAVEAWSGPDAADWCKVESPWRLAVLCEGTEVEVNWSIDSLKNAWPGATIATVEGDEADALLTRVSDFETTIASPLVAKIAVLPGRLAEMLNAVRAIDEHCSIAARAADGVAICAFSRFDDDLLKAWVAKLQPAAVAASGSATMIRCDSESVTRQARWGAPPESVQWMKAVKSALDPAGRLNPGRYFL